LSKKQFKLSKQTKQAMALIMLVMIFAATFMFIKAFPPPTSTNGSTGIISGAKTVKLTVTIKVYTEVKASDNWYNPFDSTIKEQNIEFDFTQDDRVAQYLKSNYTIEKIELDELRFYAKAEGGYEESYVKVDILGISKTFYNPTGAFYQINIDKTVTSSKVTATVTVYVYAKAFCTPKIVAKDFTLTATVYLVKGG